MGQDKNPANGEVEVLQGLSEICAVARTNRRRVQSWIRDNGFPAWKAPGETCWRAFRHDILDWFKNFRG